MILDLSKEFDRQKFTTYSEFLLKKGCVVELKERKLQRTLPQNRYLYLLLGYFASETGYSIDEVKVDLFKRQVNPELFVRERENRRGEKVKYLRSTAVLDTGEMTTAIERFRNWAAQGGIYLPAPNEGEALLEAEKQIAMYERYL